MPIHKTNPAFILVHIGSSNFQPKMSFQMEWDDTCIGDRINGILLQLISCLQNRRCPQYFLPTVDLFKGKSTTAMDSVAKQVWRILRELLTNPRSLEAL